MQQIILFFFFFFQSAAIRNSPHIVQGTVYTGNQFQYHIENQVRNFCYWPLVNWLPAKFQNGVMTYISKFIRYLFY